VTFCDSFYTNNGSNWLGQKRPTVLAVYRTNNTTLSSSSALGAVANPGLNWSSFYYTDPRWIRDSIGLVFGTTFDNNKNIYISATRFFGIQPIGKSTGAIYKIDGITGEPKLFFDLNPGGSRTDFALGNLKFFNGYIYVSNLKDGKLYAINVANPNNLSLNYSYLPSSWTAGDKPCGLAIRNIGVNPRLFFSRNGFNATTTSIYSIDLNSNGSFGTNQIYEISIASYSNNDDPITDMAFNKDFSQLLLAQKSNKDHNGGYVQINTWNHNSVNNIYRYAHTASIIKFAQNPSGTNSGDNWTNQMSNFEIGAFHQKSNSSGGVDFSDFEINKNKSTYCDTSIYATTDLIFANPTYVPSPPITSSWTYCYGITGFKNQQNAGTQNGINIDSDNSSTYFTKGVHGDIEILDTSLQCPKPCQCSQTLTPYLYWDNGTTQDSASIACGSNKTNFLDCNKKYTIKVKNPCGINCPTQEVDYTITYPNGNVQTTTSFAGMDLNVGILTGDYIVEISATCNGIKCPPCKIIFKQTKICQPVCNNCKDKVQATFNSGVSTVAVAAHPAASTLNASFYLDGGTDTYTEISANIVDVQISSGQYINGTFVPGSAACLQCYNNANNWGSIVGGTLTGFTSAITSYTGVSASHPYNNPREAVFTTTTPTALPFGTALNLTMKIPGISTISCCCITVKAFVKITYRNNKCEECSKVVLIDVTQCPGGTPTSNGGVGTATFNLGGHPQLRIAAPTKGSSMPVNFENNIKNNK
jgi:hypothetical protein